MQQSEKKGEWKEVRDSDLIEDGYVCTACGRYIHDFLPLPVSVCTLEFEKELVSDFKFCPNCGAEMVNSKKLKQSSRNY